MKLRQTTKFPREERITFTVDNAPLNSTALKIRIPYWATNGAQVSINGESQTVTPTLSTYLTLQYDWKSGNEVTTGRVEDWRGIP